jgi:hypothetical protein
MSKLLYPFYRLTGVARRPLPSLSTAIVLAGLSFALPQSAFAEAGSGPEIKQGPSGLPDGRVYEQVSPKNKFGNEAAPTSGETPPYVAAGADGDEVAYFKNGPFGETQSGFDFFSIGRRFSDGWQSHGAVSRGEGIQGAFRTNPQNGLGFSSDMTASVFATPDVFVPEQELSSPTPHIYRFSEDGLVQWIGKPTISEPVRFRNADRGDLAGASSDLSTIYFAFEGSLVPADEEPNPALGNISYSQELHAQNEGAGNAVSEDSFYEWHEGVLEAAGVLPDGHLDPYGAAPAVIPASTNRGYPEEQDNEVSEDGRSAFFVSPDPESNSGRPSELYVRQTAQDGTQKTTLVSRDLLLAEVDGLPSAAPSGVLKGLAGSQSYIYASPDGSRVFFTSTDQLTADAPSDQEIKVYEFDTVRNTLTYIPGLSTHPSEILHSSRNGSNLLFASEGELGLWNEGTVTNIAQGFVKVTRSTETGSVYVFQTRAAFPEFGFNNGDGEYEEVYRYETAGNTLSCISCPPAGTAPLGDAELSHAFPSGNEGNTFLMLTADHGMSDDAGRIFFDTPSALVAQDTNGVRDAYEWENGTVYLISTGVSRRESFFGDNSPSGNDVFFSTAEGLAPGDADEGYDLYDARVPRPGDQLPPSAVPCEGAVCQGPPSVPQLLTPPASEAFDGPGDLEPPPSHSTPKSLTRKQRLARALKACKSHKKVGKRRKCERQARGSYGTKAAAARQRGGVGRHHNGRGK